MLWRMTPAMVQEEIKKIGAHPGSWPIFANKCAILPLKLEQVRTPAANVLKQELLSLGGDAVTPMSTITGKDEYVNVILLGTRRQYQYLVDKLQTMDFFGLKTWREEIAKILTVEQPTTTLADDRVLQYERPLIMGILNLTPDSFYADSRVAAQDDVQAVVQAAGRLLLEGADILDLGAESTRPGAEKISVDEEIKRLLPALKVVRLAYPEAIISVDTNRADTAHEALKNGANIINDVSGQDSLDMWGMVTLYHAPWIITHNGPGGIFEVTEKLLQRAEALKVPKDKVILDPGIGFGKTVAENLEIIRNLSVLTGYGYPVLLGTSRKSVIGKVLDLPAEERLEGTLATSVVGALQGANILRVHDVEANRRAVKMAEALK